VHCREHERCPLTYPPETSWPWLQAASQANVTNHAERVTAPEPERGGAQPPSVYPASADPIRRASPAQPRTLTMRVDIPGTGQSILHDSAPYHPGRGRSMAGEPETSDIFRALTWGDLDEWAGAKALSRGKRYQREGRVRELACLPWGDLIAWVAGTRRYATTVSTDGESIESRCTCPVGDSCKHAVAVVLEYLESVKKGLPIPAAAEDDPRLRLLDSDATEHTASSPAPSLRPCLEGLTKEELIDLLETLARHDPHVRTAIDDRRSIAATGAGPLLKALLSEIDAAADERPWGEYRGGGIPDYSRVQERMETLLSMGHADEVVRAGEVLLQKGIRQVEMVDDEGETIDQIASCMDVVFSALAVSSRPAHEKILYAIDADLKDEYDLCAGAGRLLAGDFPEEEWGITVDLLLRRLEESSPAQNNDDVTTGYGRDRLVAIAVTALDKAGRQDEATVLQIMEADRTDTYPELVARLLRERRRDEALQWIHRGIHETEETAPGIADELRTMLREMREREGNWPAVAAIRAEAFFHEPTYPAFRCLEEASRRAGVWNGVRDAAMRYLIAGERPPAGDGAIPGVLPDTGIGVRASRWEITAPVADTLIEIAIAEKKPDEVLRWYDRWEEDEIDRHLRHNLEDRVADAVVDTHPKRAIAIWKKKTERLIAETRLQSYEESLQYVRKLRSHMETPEWEEYLGELRRKHARKRRFLEVLGRVEDRRIIEDS